MEGIRLEEEKQRDLLNLVDNKYEIVFHEYQ